MRPPIPPVSRRSLLWAGAAGAAALLAGCGAEEPPAPENGTDRVRYGSDPSQYADLRRPQGRATLTVVLLHGGYWRSGYGADLMDPLAERLTAEGCATWNLEYRRVGDGGGWPATFEDVAAGLDALAEQDVPHAAGQVVLLGHSAGGHLAAWVAGRTADTPGGPPAVRPARAVSLSGVLDLTRASDLGGSAAPTRDLLGGTPEEVPGRYALGDPALLPPACPVWAVHAEDDTVVDRSLAASYVARVTAAGAEATLVDVPGDHFTLIDPDHPSYATTADLVLRGRPSRASSGG